MKDIKKVYEEKVEKLGEFFASCGCLKAVVALSGGIDSAVVVPLAVAALGAENVRVVLLPTRYSSQHSVDDALYIAEKLGIENDKVSIDDIFAESLKAIEPLKGMVNSGLAAENMQARIRCMVTMAISNATGALMLNTSNRSEILVGYGTLYGDTSGAVSVIGDLYKDEVYALARCINEIQGDVIPENILTKAPSAELRDGQKDSDSLPDYPILDAILRLMADENLPAEEIVSKGFEKEVVEKVFTLSKASAFKLLQLPPLL
ncbi:MAG: NAD(+) synthase [Rikenellaceae bacterium]